MSSVQPSHRFTLQVAQAANGALFREVDGYLMATHFGEEGATSDTVMLEAARNGVALFDLSHWSLLEMQGSERLDYLHNQTTNNIKALSPGLGCETCIVTPTARLVDLVTAYVTLDSVLLLTSPSDNSVAYNSLNRLIAFSDAQLTDISSKHAVFTLVGPQSQEILTKLNFKPPLPTLHAHRTVEKHDDVLRVATGSGLAIEGYTLIVAAEKSCTIWSALVEAGAIPCGTDSWETLRIVQGRPAIGKEITTDYNPLEAGLWHTASFMKGCYIGQETIARLDTFKGVKQQLWGLELDTLAPIGTAIYVGEQRAGMLTSITNRCLEGSYRGLGYIRTKLGGNGLDVLVGNAKGKTVPIPYSTRERQSASL